MKLVNTPMKNAASNAKCFKSNITAASVIGVASKNEYLAALSLSTPNHLAVVIVIPERDVPGNAAAIACEQAIHNDCLNVICS